MKKSILGIIIAIIAVLAVAGILVAVSNNDDNGGEDRATTETTQNPPASMPPATPNTTEEESDEDASASDQVTIDDMAFSPANVTVRKGTTVTWTNQDSVAHTVTSDSGNTLDSDLLNNGESFSFTFNETGTFAYHCTPHPQMTGTVTVTD